MKAYVIKRDDGKFYYNWVLNREYEFEPQFTRDINKVLHNNKIYTKNECDIEIRSFELKNCESVEVSLIEGDLEEHDKQVRNELIDEIEQEFTNYLPLRNRTGAGFYAKLNEIRKRYEENKNE